MPNLKKLIPALCCICSSFFFHAQALELSLNDMLNRIEKENIQVLIQREAVEQALQASYIQRAQLLPSVNLEAQQSKSKTFFTSLGRPTSAHSRDFRGQLVGTMSLLDLSRYGDYESARKGYLVSKLGYQAIKEEILAAAATAYYTHIRNLNRMRVIEANIERDQLLLDLATHQFKAGIASPLDVTRAEVRLASDEKDQLQQTVLVRKSELELNKLLDIDPSNLIKTDHFLQEPTAAIQPSAWSIKQSFQSRPDYLKAKQELAKSKFDRRAAEWKHLPTLSAFGNWEYGSVDALNGKEKETWSVGLKLTVPIFQGFGVHANTLNQKAKMRAQQYTLKNLENTIKTEFALNQADVASRFQQISIANKQVALANKELELAQERFKKGISSNQEVVDAQTNVAAAEDSRVESLYQYYLSRLEWARLMGNVRSILNEN